MANLKSENVWSLRVESQNLQKYIGAVSYSANVMHLHTPVVVEIGLVEMLVVKTSH